MIKLQIIGNLGRDCVENEVNGKHVINFNVAHSEKYKDATGNTKDRTTWVNCAYWTERTAVAQYLTKGKKVYVEGTPDVDAYMKDNTPAATLRMRVHNLELLSGSSSDQTPDTGLSQLAPKPIKAVVIEKPASPVTVVSDSGSDDLPF